MTLLAADIVLFADGRPQKLIPRLFEDVVFMMSFLFYGIDFHNPDYLHIFFRFLAQFLMWWLFGCVTVWAWKRK